MDTRLHCDAPDSVRLIFERDTLTIITVSFGVKPIAASERWFAVADSLIALYGEPDSVRTTADPVEQVLMTTLRAYWGPLATSKPWRYVYDAFDMRNADRASSTAQFSLEGCLLGGPRGPCMKVLKRQEAK